MNRIRIEPTILKWARERSSLTIEELEKKFPKYRLWESGEAGPTLRQLESLAKKTLTHLGCFFLPKPPDDKLPIPDFRTLKDSPMSRPSPNLLETIQTMQRRQEWMRNYLVEQGMDRLPFIGSTTADASPDSVAGQIRDCLSRTDGWAEKLSSWEEALRVLRDAAEDAGIMVVTNGVVNNSTSRKLSTEEFRGFVLVDDYAPLIFINGSDAKGAQMFSLVHELAHIWMGETGVFNLIELQPANNATEKFCNRVAAEFLVPKKELKTAWPELRECDEPFQAAARKFKVSPVVAARRALDLRLISQTAFFEFYNAYQSDERRKKLKSSGGDFYRTQNNRVGYFFGGTVVRAVKEGHLLYRDAYQLTGLTGKTFDNFAEQIDRGLM